MSVSFNEFIETIDPRLAQVRSEHNGGNSKASRGLGFVALIANGAPWLKTYLEASLCIDGHASQLVEVTPEAHIQSPLLGLYLSRGIFKVIDPKVNDGTLFGSQLGFWNVPKEADRHDISRTADVLVSESYVSEILGIHGEHRVHPNPHLLANEAVISATAQAF